MLFNSIEFLIFFPVVTTLFFIFSHRWRWAVLLAASYYFYMSWKPEYIILIIISTLISWFSGQMIYRFRVGILGKLFLLVSILANLGILFTFKYYNFFGVSIQNLSEFFGASMHFTPVDLIIPVGISFYTFQVMSYSIEIYMGKQKPGKHLGKFALYVSFFPQLVAGPIERPGRLLPQFDLKKKFCPIRFRGGMRLILFGLFKKIAVADSIAPFVDKVYNSPDQFTGPVLCIATILFAFQIFCDFSGYSDIAIGAALIMGFDLMENFKRPYHAISISDFWRRWHISLSTWFRDYVYIPLGGSRVRVSRLYINLIVLFIVSGFWHGANWTFIVWGALNATYLIIEKSTKGLRKSLLSKTGLNDNISMTLLGVAYTFSATCFAWIFFRASSLDQAFYIATHLFVGWDSFGESFLSVFWVQKVNFLFACGSIAFMEILHLIDNKANNQFMFQGRPIYVRWACYFIMLALILSAIPEYEVGSKPFLYFQF